MEKLKLWDRKELAGGHTEIAAELTQADPGFKACEGSTVEDDQEKVFEGSTQNEAQHFGKILCKQEASLKTDFAYANHWATGCPDT